MLADLNEYEERDVPLHCTTQFWHGPDDDYDICPACGNEMHGESTHCITCASRIKAPDVQDAVQRFLAYARRERGRRLVHSWWEGTEVT